jgi:hypothetical protein
MTEREILAAVLRWSTAYEARRAICAEQYRYMRDRKKLTGFGGSSVEIGQRLKSARRKEQAAIRDLAKICAKVRRDQKRSVDATYTIDDLPVKLLTLQT